MRNYKRLLWIAFFTGICIAALRAAVPQAWDVQLDRMPVTPRVMQGFRGETIELQPRFLDRGRPLTLATDATVRLWIRGADGLWYAGHDTNGALHADPGRVSVNWLPADDDGQTNVAFRVGVEDSGRSYRAFGTLTWIDAPGASPAGTLIPLGTLDWSTFDNSNTDMAPFVRKADFTLNALNDVNTTGVTNGMVMIYNAATEEWLPAAIADPIARALAASAYTAGTNSQARLTIVEPLAATWDGGTNGLVAATGRASLGLGTAAQSNATAFATAAQGALATQAVARLDIVEPIAAAAVPAGASYTNLSSYATSTVGDTNKIHILLYGQSNAHGTGSSSTLETVDIPTWAQPTTGHAAEGADFANIYWIADGSLWMNRSLILYADTTFGPDFYGAIALRRATGKHIYITKVARGGVSIDGFVKPSTGYTNVTTAVAGMQAANPGAGTVDVIWWVHGESGGTDYEAKLSGLMDDLISDFGHTGTRVVVAGLAGSFSTNATQAALVSYGMTSQLAKYIDSADLPLSGDGVHLSALGHKLRGERMASATLAFGADYQYMQGFEADGPVTAARVIARDGLASGGDVSADGALSGHELRVGGGKTSIDGLIVRDIPDTRALQYTRPAAYDGGTSWNAAWITDVARTISLGWGGATFTFYSVRGYVTGGSSTRSLSVKLLDVPAALSYRPWSIELTPMIGSSLGNLPAKATLLWTTTDQTKVAYGTTTRTTSAAFRWLIGVSENISAAAGDVIVCGDSTRFIVDAAVTETNSFRVRYHWNPNDTTSYTPVSTNTPIRVISGGTTNEYASAHVTSSSAPADYRDLIYAASDGWYMIPRYYTFNRVEIDGYTNYGWTPYEDD